MVPSREPCEPDCLIVGAVNVDLLGRVEHLGERDGAVMMSQVVLAPGGHAGNCAVGMARLGRNPRILACCGQDALGAMAHSSLAAAGVDVAWVQTTTRAATGMAVIPVLPNGDRVLYLTDSANAYLDPYSLERAARGCRWMIVFDPPPAFLVAAAALSDSLRILFAPGSLLSHARAQDLTPLLEAAALLVLNEPESRCLSAQAVPARAACALSDRWRIHVAVTIGPGGCWLASPDTPVRRVPGYAADVVDTTGAGDAFVAGTGHALLAGASLPEAVTFGCATGALATRAMGAQASLPDPPQVHALLDTRPTVSPPSKLGETLRTSADGWRGPSTPGPATEATTEIATGLGLALRERGIQGRILIGCDARATSAALAGTAALALQATGQRTDIVGLLPTPLAAAALHRPGYVAALLVTASHNAAAYTGIKLKIPPGRPPDAELERSINLLRTSRVNPSATGRVPVIQESRRRAILRAYLTELDQHVAMDPSPNGLQVVVDGLAGIAGSLLVRVLRAAGCRVQGHRCRPDPTFQGLVPDPMTAASRAWVQARVPAVRADLGLLVDGDGDRLGVIDARGRFVWPHEVLAVLLHHLPADRLGPGGVATTVATGSLPHLVATALGRELLLTAVGFKHLAPLLAQDRAAVGGGGVGDIGFRFFGLDRDACLAALLLIEVLTTQRQPLHMLVEQLHEHYGRRCYTEAVLPSIGANDPATLERAGRQALAGVRGNRNLGPVTHVDGVRFTLDDGTALLLRAATTEPVLRVCAEAPTPQALDALLTSLRTVLRKALP